MESGTLTDEALVVIVRERDKERYSEIIQRYQQKLAHYLRKFIHNHDELEDVLQATFIKTYENLYGFDSTKRFSPWIYRIAHNEAVNYLKKASKTGIALDDVEYRLFDESIDLPSSIDLGLLKPKIEAALAAMKPKYRETMILYFFEQKSYEEISDILRVPTSTVGTLLLRGKKMLKKALAEAYGKQ